MFYSSLPVCNVFYFLILVFLGIKARWKIETKNQKQICYFRNEKSELSMVFENQKPLTSHLSNTSVCSACQSPMLHPIQLLGQ